MENRESPITPTVGRIVLVRGGMVDPRDWERELPAIITKVWGPSNLSVHIFGVPEQLNLLEGVKYDNDLTQRIEHARWRWMPYQVQVAKERDPATGAAREPGVGATAAAGNTPQPSVLERVQQELADLVNKSIKLGSFLVSPAAEKLSEQHQLLLTAQAEAMGKYGDILAERVKLLASGG